MLIDLKSDLVPGVELVDVRVTLLDTDTDIELEPIAVARDANVAEGVRIARVEGLDPSPARRIRVVAHDVLGEEVTRQTIVVVNRDDAATTVMITRDCRGVTCEDANTRCLGSRCVDETCLTGAEESCPEPACSTAADCGGGFAECASSQCVDGVCVAFEDTAQCGAALYCDARLGCRGVPTVLSQCDDAVFLAPSGCDGDCSVRAVDLAVGWRHTCWVDTNAEVWCTGRNDDGQLGQGDRFGRLEPTRVELQPASRITVGQGFSCALLMDGSIQCWGLNDQGQLGVGDRISRPVPAVAIEGGPWVDLYARYDATCAIDAAGTLACWGDNVEGQIGDGTDTDALSPFVREGTWSTIGPGQGHACGIRTDGTLWCWGRNTEGQLGQPEGAPGQSRSPLQVGTDTDWVAVHSSQGGSCAIKVDGTLWCWGESLDDGFALGTQQVFEPTLRPDGTDWTDVDVSLFHGCGLRGSVGWCWGRGFEAQTGIVQSDPVAPRIVEAGPWIDVEVGRFSTFFVRDDGALFGSGTNCGRLGNGSPDNPGMFVEISR